jgi:hypothetical protein
VDRLAREARTTALVATSVIAAVGLLAGAVRVLPWWLDPSVPWGEAEPFARGLAAVAMEAALLVGWPVGWSLAAFRFAEVGEARVLQTLGEAPHRTVARLAPHGALFAAALAAMAFVYGHDATAPGRVATELLARGRSSCAAVRSPATYPVPFTEMTWLCAPDRGPRLVGPAPGGLDAILVTASDARIAGDFRAIELDDARVLVPAETPLDVHVRSLDVRGMAPWARASTLAPPVRALVLVAAGWLLSMLVAYLVLAGSVRTRLGALVLGGAGPIAALATMRLLERAASASGTRALASHSWVFFAVPLAGSAVALALAKGMAVAALAGGFPFSRLRLTGRAASTWFKV